MEGKRILVAEDDPSVRLTLQFVLADEGFEVLVAADGQAAVELATSERPDAILLDRMMPKLNGKQVLEALRADEDLRDIPIFVVSGLDEASPEEWPGVVFVGKPFAPEVLVGRIRHALEDG